MPTYRFNFSAKLAGETATISNGSDFTTEARLSPSGQAVLELERGTYAATVGDETAPGVPDALEGDVPIYHEGEGFVPGSLGNLTIANPLNWTGQPFYVVSDLMTRPAAGGSIDTPWTSFAPTTAGGTGLRPYVPGQEVWDEVPGFFMWNDYNEAVIARPGVVYLHLGLSVDSVVGSDPAPVRVVIGTDSGSILYNTQVSPDGGDAVVDSRLLLLPGSTTGTDKSKWPSITITTYATGVQYNYQVNATILRVAG